MIIKKHKAAVTSDVDGAHFKPEAPRLMKNISVFLGIFSLFAMTALAGDGGENPMAAAAAPGPFDRGTWELEAGSGEYWSFASSSAKWMTINYQLEVLRLGWMYDSPRHSGWLRGNNELLLEAFGGVVTKGPGSYLAGGSPLWRYNFVQPEARLVPYIQLGMGALGTNISKCRRQREIGEEFNFALQGGVGLKYLINDRWSASVEADYRHISDAGMSARNQGLNSIGGLILVSYCFH
jgi:opacity protein-like surface antigen